MNPDTTPVKLDKFSIAENYKGLLDLEKQGHCMVEKLQFFENQLRETRIKIQALTFSKMELEKILEKERKELESSKSQLKVFQDAMQYWEREHLNERNSLVVQSLQLEILQKEKITLNDEIKDLENKNIKLTMQVEEIQTQLRNQNDLSNSMNYNQKTFDKTVEKVYNESQKLENDFNFLKKQVTLSKHAGEQMIVLLKHHHEALNRVYEENESLKRLLFTQAGELQSEKKTPKSHDMNLNKIEVEILQKKLKESEKKIADLNRELDSEKNEKRKLSETLNIALGDQIRFNELEQYLRTCISNLENELEKKFQSDSNFKMKII